MLEPTHEQRARLQSLEPGKLVLVQFLAIQDHPAFEQYLLASERAVAAQGGQRTHGVHIDQYLAGRDMHYQAITIDRFSSPTTMLTAFDAANAERQTALSDVYALLVRPSDRLPRIAKILGFFAPILRRILGTTSAREIPESSKFFNPEKSPVPETIAVLRAHDQSTPFYMMNLNKYYPKARYQNGADISGEQAYNRYSARIAPYLVSVGGYPDIFGHTVGLFVGDENSPLHDDWSDFAMVYYPSRQNFVKMLTNSPERGGHHRDAGLDRAVLMPSSDWA